MNKVFYSKFENLLGATHLDTNADPPVLVPPDEDLLCETIRLAESENVKVRIIGGGTFPAPHKARDVIPVSLTGLCEVKEVNPSDFVIISQAGVIVDRAVEEARNLKLFLPLDITSGSEATVGGAFMAGSVGPSNAGYGPFRNAVIGVKCVSARGEIVNFGGRTIKNVTGYDLQWFLGGTMGLYAITVELTIKVHPLPETRMISVARCRPGSKTFKAVTSLMERINNIKSLEFIACEGLGGEITIGAGFDGMETPVRKYMQHFREIMRSARMVEYREDDPEVFKSMRRLVSKQFVGQDFYTVSVPPSASETFLGKLRAVSPNMPVIAHPLMGRFHIVCSDIDCMDVIKKISLAIGGKLPVEWGAVVSEGISGLFTGAELAIARSLKRELDPSGILNPHLRLL